MTLALCRTYNGAMSEWVKTKASSTKCDFRSTARERTSWATAATSEKCQKRNRSLAEPKTKEPRTHRGSSCWR